jgi:hypothetical protein
VVLYYFSEMLWNYSLAGRWLAKLTLLPQALGATTACWLIR